VTPTGVKLLSGIVNLTVLRFWMHLNLYTVFILGFLIGTVCTKVKVLFFIEFVPEKMLSGLARLLL
jgi:hypothetical protein